MNLVVRSALTDIHWLYDHSGKEALIRLGEGAAMGASPAIAPLQSLNARVKSVVVGLAMFLSPSQFVLGELRDGQNHRVSGELFSFAVPVSLCKKKPAPWLIQPCLAAYFFDIRARPLSLLSVFKSLDAENKQLKHEILCQRQQEFERAVQLSSVELASAQSELLDARRALTGLRLEYEDLYRLWERTDAARRELAAKIGAALIQQPANPATDPPEEP
ncbi:MAG: hypothetical protein KBG84_16955 [Planctomycetes bacterium]|nr:hypothetical protein [Planctomycetota bacterium]